MAMKNVARGSDGNLTIVAPGGSGTVYTLHAHAWTLEYGGEILNATAYSDSARRIVPDIPEWKGTYTTWVDKTTGITIAHILSTNTTLAVITLAMTFTAPSTYSDSYSGDCIVSNFRATHAFRELVQYEMNFEGDNALTASFS